MAITIEGLVPLIQVFDMPISLRFYRDVLGFEVVRRSGTSDGCGWVWLRLNGAELMLNTAYDDGQRPPQPDGRRLAAHNDTALFIGCPDVDGAYEHLLAHGLQLEKPKIAPYGMKQLYAKDPDGYGLCFQWPAEQNETR